MMDSYESVIPHIEVNHAGKFRLVRPGDAYASPGTCISCRVTPSFDNPFIDFGMYIEFHGNVYFCLNCFTEVCTIIGFMKIEGSELQQAESAVAILQLKNQELRDELRSYKDVFDKFSNYVRSTMGIDVIPNARGEVQGKRISSHSGEVDGEADEGVGEKGSSSLEPSERTGKFDDEQGYTELLDTSGFEADEF